MSFDPIFAVTLFLYGGATLAVWIAVFNSNQSQRTYHSQLSLIGYLVAWSALIGHVFLVLEQRAASGALDPSLHNMTLLTSLVVVLSVQVSGLRATLRPLAIVIYPMTILSLLFFSQWPESGQIGRAHV